MMQYTIHQSTLIRETSMKLVSFCLFVLLLIIPCFSILADDLPDGWESSFAEVNGLKLHVIRTSGDKQPIVMAHGGLSNGVLCWEYLAKAFQKQYDVIMYDSRGHGDSQRAKHDYSLHTLAKDLAGLIQNQQLNKPILIGHSMGSYATLFCTAENPELPRAIVLIDPLIRSYPSKDDKDGLVVFNKWVRDTKKEFVKWKSMSRDELLEYFPPIDPLISKQGRTVEKRINSIQKLDINALSVIDHIGKMRFEDFKNMFKKITCPVLILSADVQGEDKEKECRLVAEFPNINIVHIVGAGHNVHHDRADECIKLISDFLEKN